MAPDVTARARPPLGPEDSARLIEFARACKAAARAVLLYPAAHPAIAATLGRIVDTTSERTCAAAAPHGAARSACCTTAARRAARTSRSANWPRSSTIISSARSRSHPGGDREAWRSFLLLLGADARPRSGPRAASRFCGPRRAAAHIELREIDYAEVLRERTGGKSASWETIVTHCVSGGAMALDESAIAELLGIAADPGQRSSS